MNQVGFAWSNWDVLKRSKLGNLGKVDMCEIGSSRHVSLCTVGTFKWTAGDPCTDHQSTQ